MVTDLNSLQSCTEYIVFELTDNYLMKFGTEWLTHNPSLLAKTKPLLDAPFMLNLDNLTC